MKDIHSNTNLLVISGLRCVGKTTLIQNLSLHPKFRKIDKYTTRRPRKNESSQQIFVDEIPPQCDCVYELYKNSPLYGFRSSQIAEIIQSGQIAVSDIIPVHLIKEIKNLYPNNLSIIVERNLSASKYRAISSARGYTNEEIENQLIQRKTLNNEYKANRNIFDHVIFNDGHPLEMFLETLNIINQSQPLTY